MSRKLLSALRASGQTECCDACNKRVIVLRRTERNRMEIPTFVHFSCTPLNYVAAPVLKREPCISHRADVRSGTRLAFPVDLRNLLTVYALGKGSGNVE